MSQSQTDICNSALQRVGAASIMNIGDNSREARACAIAYDSNRRAELRRREWKFAIKRQVLAPDVATPPFGFRYAFSLPADCIRVIYPTNDASLDWVVENRKILTNTIQSPFLGAGNQPATTGPALFLRYVADIEDAALFDPAFYELLSISMAIDICEPLTNSNQKKAALQQDYQNALNSAAKTQSFERLSAEGPDDGWWLARVH